MDSFVSRVVFFCIIFGACLVLAKLLYWLFDTAGLIKARVTRARALASPHGRTVFVRVMTTMETKISVPQYELRGFSLWGFRDMAHCMDFLFDGGRVKQGTLRP